MNKQTTNSFISRRAGGSCYNPKKQKANSQFEYGTVRPAWAIS